MSAMNDRNAEEKRKSDSSPGPSLSIIAEAVLNNGARVSCRLKLYVRGKADEPIYDNSGKVTCRFPTAHMCLNISIITRRRPVV